MKKLLIVLLLLALSACGPAESPVIPAVELTVAPTIEPTPILTPKLPEMVGERGKLSLSLTEIEVAQGECSSPVVELEAFVDDLKFNFLPMNSNNPMNGISVCSDGLLYGAGTGSKKFGIYAPVSLEPGTYQINVVVEIGIDYHPAETLSIPLTVTVIEKKE
jgi:hypothetical protein